MTLEHTRSGVMIDLETFGKGGAAAIASLAAVRFSFGDTEPEDTIATIMDNPTRYMYRVIDLDSQNGRKFDGDTIKWWLRQPDEARMAVASDQTLPLESVLNQLRSWWPPASCAYSKGATFDLTILENAYRQFRIKPPFDYQQELCARTVFDLSGEPIPQIELGTHNALNDAILQVIWFQRAWKRLRGK